MSERVAVRAVELSEPLHDLTDVADATAVRLYGLWRGRPLGFTELRHGGRVLSAARVRAALVGGLDRPLLAALLAERFGPDAEDRSALPSAVPVSVVIATLDRPDDLRGALSSVLAQKTARPFEVVVVDNHPASGLTAPVVADFPGVVLVPEPRRGLAYARNAGFRAARGEVLVATDDDVTAPPDWLERLVAPFARPEVGVVTGNVLPLELQTEAQRLFEAYGGLGRGFTRREVDGRWFHACRRAVPTWTLGATANAAVRTAVLRDPAVGLMDEALGPGMPSGVGEDTYLFYRALRAGHTLVYRPDAYVWHRHRRDRRALARQLYGYSKGHVAYHLTTWWRDGDRRALVYLLAQVPRHRLREVRWRTVPWWMLALQLAGNLAGPWALWRSRRRVRREGRSGAGA